ncbi:MAG: hypothetical protein GTO55_08705 [Armatimonadetes bacterium]|nr:hypothetical protein [Armatimonadota bacterium]NIM24326.1 hypothetical protein [Armatimonadota bacterium]NIM68195.1 hypothetical protein [Armatimonadota bacterium]NIM76655.1 hypothetical protein [Armatimonadota bacterium]NIN06400.1 hypothetical protein [Armatimonadota bacterium]
MAEETLNTAKAPSAPGLVQWLFNPFAYIAGGRSLGIGLAAILLAGFLGSFSNTHFDGVLDVHTGRGDVLWVFLTEGIVNWLSLGIVLFILGRFVSRTRFRALDLFGTQAMARWPMIFVAAASLLPPYQRFLISVIQNLRELTQARGNFYVQLGDAAVAAVVIVIIVAAIVWMVALMYRSYSICCNVRGGRAIASFIAGLVMAEAASKVIVLKMLTI